MHTTIITGINGFVGQHLAREMHQAGCEVWGIGRDATPSPEIAELVTHYYQCDLTDANAVAKLPWQDVNSVINLAGLANVAASFGQADLYKKVNVDVLKNLGAALLAKKLTAVRVLAVSTGAVYDPTQQPPFNEQSATVKQTETSPYVASKLIMEQVARDQQTKGLDVVIVRPLNHVGPGQLPGFLVPDLAEQITAAITQKQGSIKVGNLASQRDYTDVRDVAHAYQLLATAKPGSLKSGIYNVCSGQPLSGQRILDLLLERFKAKGLSVEVDQSRIRPDDPPVLYGDCTALKTDTGWHPTIAIDQTIADFAAWRRKQAS